MRAYVPTLIETGRQTDKRTLLSVGAGSLAMHAVVIIGAVAATLSASRRDAAVKVDTTAIFLEPPQSQPMPPAPPPVSLDFPLKGFQTLTIPVVILTSIPPVDLQTPFDPKDYTGTGVEGGRANGTVPGDNEVYTESLVDERPELLSAPPPPYPKVLSDAGIQGRVILQAIVDTTGRVVPGSVKIVQSPSPGFDIPVEQWVLKALFRPARRLGRAVRVYVNLPVDYSATRRG